MASTFAAQLRSIAANSSHELDLKARREAHAESLIFERDVAVKQDWDTLYQVCLEGFQELCLLDARLQEFDNNLFSPQSKDQDRDQLTNTQNQALGLVIERCLALIGAKVLLRPGIKAVEWLVRRFRVHIFDTSALLSTFLPFHESPVFRNVLSIVPANKIVNDWKFLSPYHKNAATVPRHAIVYAATNNDVFFSTFNAYVLRACEDGAGQTQVVRFWGSLMVESITGRLHLTKSGRREVQKQRQEDALLKILPILVNGLEIQDCPELTLACFTISIVLVSNASFDDSVIDSITDAIVPFLNIPGFDTNSVLVCLSVLIAHKSDRRVSRSLFRELMKFGNLHESFIQLHATAPVATLLEALLLSSLVGLSKKNFEVRLNFLSLSLQKCSEILSSSAIGKVVVLLLQKIETADNSNAFEAAIRVRILSVLRNLADSPQISLIFSEIASETGKSLPELEAIIGSTIEVAANSQALLPSSMDIDSEEPLRQSQGDIADSALADIPSETPETSFILNRTSLFDQLAQAFTLCYRSRTLLEKFQDLPIWRTEKSEASSLYESFVLRFALSTSGALERAAALQTLEARFGRYPTELSQLLLPYLTVLLADASHLVRHAASTIIIASSTAITKSQHSEKIATTEPETLHDPWTGTDPKRIAPSNIAKILHQAYMPALEECVLDPSHIGKVLQVALESTSPSSSSGPKANMELKKSLRQNLFDLLTFFATACPLLKAKTSIVEMLIHVHKVGSTTTVKALSLILKDWSKLDASQAEDAVRSENLPLSHVDGTFVQLISPSDKEAVERILNMFEVSNATPRSELILAIFDRVASIWKAVRPEIQVNVSTRLFEMCFSSTAPIAQGSRHIFLSNLLSSQVLSTLLDFASSGLAQMQSEGPAKKRRRTSHGRDSSSNSGALDFDATVSRLTFALEIVDGSKPENHPSLLNNLFELLVTLRRINDRSTSESPYLLTLCLSSILAILQKAQGLRKPNIDMSAIRADLVTDCVRASDNPQVQTTALLVAASLATLAPDRVLHNIMPIFTFSGQSLFSKEDDRSIFVTNQAIDQIIPPLVASLKKQDANNLIDATSSLLASFVTAYDHIPQHRRVAFYQRLLNRLGVEDFAFAIVALLRSRRPTDNISTFLSDLMGNLPAESQLITYRSLIKLTSDVLELKLQNAGPLLGINTSTSVEKKEREASLLLGASLSLLKSNGLNAQTRRIRKLDPSTADQIRREYRTSLTQILALLTNAKATHPNLVSAIRDCLNALLELPSTADLLNLVPVLLDEMSKLGDEDLQPLALRVLASHLQHKPLTDAKTRAEAVSFLPTLENLITSTKNEALRHASISCVDRIVEVYGRKDPEAVLSTSSALVEGDNGLSSKDSRTQLMSLLCLASMMEALKESAVPIIPLSIHKVLAILEHTLQDKSRGMVDLHNAAFSLLSAFFAHVPFMLSDENVVDILRLSYKSSLVNLGGESQESRKETLALLAHNLDLSTVTSTLAQALKDVVDDFEDTSFAQLLHVLLQAVERNSKSAVVQSADGISELLLQVLDIHRLIALRDDTLTSESSAISRELNTISIAFIYKLNNTTFKPIFETWIDWATKGTDLPDEDFSPTAKNARLTPLFNLLTHFFTTLKSIVTSYASYILEPVNEVLSTMHASATDTKAEISRSDLELYSSTLQVLSAALTYDQGTIDAAAGDADDPGFFTRHFGPLATNLTNQLTLVGTRNKSLRAAITSLLPKTLVALATSTMDTPARHQSINHALCQLRHHGSAAVRLAGIRTNLAITEDDVVGDEWINNIVVGASGEGGVGGAGETMVYVNEALEDDDEEVEREVRRWVRLVRDKVGEDVFEV